MLQAALTLPMPVTLPSVTMPMPDPSFSAPTANLTPEPAPALTATAPLILFGRDDAGRPHAACFVGHETDVVERAAGLMGHTFVVAETEVLRALAAKLPSGRLFASGKGFVPFVATALYEWLLTATGAPDSLRPAKAAGKAAEAGSIAGIDQGSEPGGAGPCDPPGRGPVPKHPTTWGQIGIGSTVLACQGPMEGWWEAVVLYTKANDSFVLRWRDWPHEPEIARARKDLGLMPPGSREGLE